MEKIVTVCSECGSENVQIRGWFNPNTQKVVESCAFEAEDNWCEDCEKHVELTLV